MFLNPSFLDEKLFFKNRKLSQVAREKLLKVKVASTQFSMEAQNFPGKKSVKKCNNFFGLLLCAHAMLVPLIS